MTGHSSPGGALAFGLLSVFLPSEKAKGVKTLSHIRKKFTGEALRRVDVLGAVLLLVFSILVVFALEEAGFRYPWSHPVIIATMTIAVISGVTFVVWEIWVERPDDSETSRIEPIFPMGLLNGRVFAGMML